MKTMRNNSFLLIIFALIYSAVLFTGCKSMSKTEKGAAVGAGVGAAAGAAIGHHSGNTAVGAIIGAAVGGAAGGLIGNYMDKQAEELREDLKGATIERVGEGIKITFDSGILFPVNFSDLTETSKQNLRELSETLKKYEDTNILIEGHTDSTGEDSYNQTLSEKRAGSVASYLKATGVAGARITTVGYGEKQPVASNETEAGKTQNRRVEVAIFANEKLKRAAKRGDI